MISIAINALGPEPLGGRLGRSARATSPGSEPVALDLCDLSNANDNNTSNHINDNNNNDNTY